MKRLLTPSTFVFVGLALTLVGIKLLFDFYPGDFPHRQQAQAFTWPLVGGMIVFALFGLFCERAAGLPDPFSDMARERRGLVIAALTGVLYGFITIGMDMGAPTRQPHMALPWSIPLYTFGAIFLEFLLRLGALCILFWFLHVVVFRRRLRLPLFWLSAAFVALYEIWPLMEEDVASGRWERVLLALAGPLYLSNVFDGLAPAALRVVLAACVSTVVLSLLARPLWRIGASLSTERHKNLAVCIGVSRRSLTASHPDLSGCYGRVLAEDHAMRSIHAHFWR